MYLLKLIVDNPNQKVNHYFSYLSKECVNKYSIVEVSFNKQICNAFVYDVTKIDDPIVLEKEFEYELKYINKVIYPFALIDDITIEKFKFMEKITLAPINTIIKLFLNPLKSFNLKETKVNFKGLKKTGKNSLKYQEILNEIEDEMEYKSAVSKYKTIINKLIKEGCLELYDISINTFKHKFKYENELNKLIKNEIKYDKARFYKLTDKQREIYENILKNDKISLIHGVTGSGKTEIYFKLAQKYLDEGGQVLILIPEIGLSPMMVERVSKKFNNCLFYNSSLNNSQKALVYDAVKENKVDIIIGTRSAIFLPFKNLKLIIIDEEHDNSYYQSSNPCYDVRNVAKYLVKLYNAKLVLASATPSIVSYTKALKNEYALYNLANRYNNKDYDIKIIDRSRDKSLKLISDELYHSIKTELSNNNQVILYLNRRGYNPYIICANCASTLNCKYCDIALNYHKNKQAFICHHCNRIYPLNICCEKCNHNHFSFIGNAIQRVEEFLINKFKDYHIARYDKDSVGNNHSKILDAFARNEYNLLIGTKMIAKGLDYPNVTLVGVIDGESGLNKPTYSASEDCFSDLMQVAGRSGRASKKGKVIIETTSPNHYIFKAIENNDYNYFYKKEMFYRKILDYPPYKQIICISFKHRNKEVLMKDLKIFTDLCKDHNFKLLLNDNLMKLNNSYNLKIYYLANNLTELLNYFKLQLAKLQKERKISSSFKFYISPKGI